MTTPTPEERIAELDDKYEEWSELEEPAYDMVSEVVEGFSALASELAEKLTVAEKTAKEQGRTACDLFDGLKDEQRSHASTKLELERERELRERAEADIAELVASTATVARLVLDETNPDKAREMLQSLIPVAPMLFGAPPPAEPVAAEEPGAEERCPTCAGSQAGRGALLTGPPIRRIECPDCQGTGRKAKAGGE